MTKYRAHKKKGVRRGTHTRGGAGGGGPKKNHNSKKKRINTADRDEDH